MYCTYNLFSDLVGHKYFFFHLCLKKRNMGVLTLCTKGQKLEFVRQNGGNPQKPVIKDRA